MLMMRYDSDVRLRIKRMLKRRLKDCKYSRFRSSQGGIMQLTITKNDGDMYILPEFIASIKNK